MPELIPAAPRSPEWLAARRQGVTATDIVTILGLSSWSSPYSLFWQKMGQVLETPDNDRFRLGRTLEPYVIDRWEEETGESTWKGGLYRHSDRAWQMATLDRGLSAVEFGVDCAAVLEVKTWADADKPAWNDGNVPAAVRAQVLWQMDVMDVAAGHVGVVFLPSGEFRSYVIEHDHVYGALDHRPAPLDPLHGPCDFCADLGLMRAAGEEFMQRLRLELPAPDPDASAATLAAVKARFARQPDKTAEVDGDFYSEWCNARFEAERLTGIARGYESKLREQAGEASVLTVDGQPVARRIIGDAQIKAHTRHSDYLKRIKTEADDNA